MTWDELSLEQKLNDLNDRLKKLEAPKPVSLPPVKKGKKRG